LGLKGGVVILGGWLQEADVCRGGGHTLGPKGTRRKKGSGVKDSYSTGGERGKGLNHRQSEKGGKSCYVKPGRKNGEKVHAQKGGTWARGSRRRMRIFQLQRRHSYKGTGGRTRGGIRSYGSGPKEGNFPKREKSFLLRPTKENNRGMGGRLDRGKEVAKEWEMTTLIEGCKGETKEEEQGENLMIKLRKGQNGGRGF